MKERDAARHPPPSSDLVEFRPPTPDDLPHLIALQTDASTMRYYGGVQEIANIRRRLELALEHEERFGYGLWSIYEQRSGEFVGIGGIIHVNFDFDSDKLEPVVCVKGEAQRRGYGRHVVERIHAWGYEAGLLHRVLGRVEIAHQHMVRLIESYEGHPLYPTSRCPSGPGDRYLFYRLLPPPDAGGDEGSTPLARATDTPRRS